MPKNALQLAVAIALVFAASYYWQSGAELGEDPDLIKRDMALAKTYLHDTRSWVYDEEGKLDEVMEAEVAEYFQRRDTSELQQPRYYAHDGNDRSWSASASTGRIRHRPGLMLLRQNVVLRNDQSGGTLASRAMTLDLRKHTARSKVPVTITQDRSRMTAQGMFAELDSERITMGPNVETVYVQTAP